MGRPAQCADALCPLSGHEVTTNSKEKYIMEKNRMNLFREVQLFLDENHAAAK